MPDDNAGNFTLVPSYRAEPGQTIMTTQHNPPLEDIAAAMTRRLPRDGSAGLTGHLNFNGFRGVNIAAPSGPNDIARLADVSSSVHVGVIVDFAGNIVPDGWLFCNGQAVSRFAFSALFAVIGTAYGAGDGVTTFNVPDLRGRVTAGVDNMGGAGSANRLSTINSTTIGGTGGTQSHALTAAELANHTHSGTTESSGGHNHSGMTGVSGSHAHSGMAVAAGAHNHGGTVDGGDHGHFGSTSVAGNHAHSASFVGGREPSGSNALVSRIVNEWLWPYNAPVAIQPAGDHQHTVTIPSSGAHSHNIATEEAHTHSLSLNSAGDHTHTIPADGTHTHAFVTTSAGANAAHNNIQPTMVLNKIIRAR